MGTLPATSGYNGSLAVEIRQDDVRGMDQGKAGGKENTMSGKVRGCSAQVGWQSYQIQSARHS